MNGVVRLIRGICHLMNGIRWLTNGIFWLVSGPVNGSVGQLAPAGRKLPSLGFEWAFTHGLLALIVLIC